MPFDIDSPNGGGAVSQGPPGPQGPQGNQGETGPPGPPFGTFFGNWDEFGIAPISFTVGDSVRFDGSVYISITGNYLANPGANADWFLFLSDGERGSSGPQGPTGPTGPQGPAGTGSGEMDILMVQVFM